MKECLEDSESPKCVKLTFICIEDSILLSTILTIVAILFGLLCIAMVTIYCVLKRRLRKATIINNEFLDEARALDTERKKKAAEDEIKLAAT